MPWYGKEGKFNSPKFPNFLDIKFHKFTKNMGVAN